MSGRRPYIALAVLAAVGCVAGAFYHYARAGRPDPIEGYEVAERPPRIRPDYSGTVIPPNIAPLNFIVAEEGTAYRVNVHGGAGEPIELCSSSPSVKIPLRAWRELLEQNRGGEVNFDVYVQAQEGWRRFDTVTNRVAREEIDPYLVYRRINVLYEEYLRMGIYQRDVRQWDEVAILDNRAFGLGCVNCHTFFDKGTERMAIHFRSGQEDYGLGMLLIQDGVVSKVDARTRYSPRPAAYTSWHPSGRLVAFSVNKVVQFFHQARTEVRDVLDLESDMGLYFVDGQEVASTPSISDPDVLESWPEWSPDGRYLYFCRAPILWSDRKTVPPENFEKLKYDLVRIGYDLGSSTWGELETVLAAEQTGLSISQPRFSPDGRFLVFCMSERSPFPVFQPDSDLYLMDMRTGRYEKIACNSDRAESWHSWSSNGRWLAFSSKRGDGLFLKTYFTHVGEDGKCSKAFVLPQEDPAFYDSFTKLFQLPELVREPVPVRLEEIAGVIRSEPWMRVDVAVTAATPRGAPDQDSAGSLPWGPHKE